MNGTGQRIDIQKVAPEAYRAVFPLQKYATSGPLEASLVALVDIRASQLNSCAWCLDMHTAEAREAGVPQRTIDLVAAWHEAGGIFSAREQAALALTEQITMIGEHGVTDEVWDRAAAEFDEDALVHLVMAIAVINVWNRMNVAARTDLPQRAA